MVTGGTHTTDLDRIEAEVLSAVMAEHGPFTGPDAERAAEKYRRIARAGALAIAALGSKKWFVKHAGGMVCLPDSEVVQWVDLSWMSARWWSERPGPGFLCLNRLLYSPELSPSRVIGLEEISPDLTDASKWREFERRHPEAADLLHAALRVAWAATLRFEVPVLLMVSDRDSLFYRAMLPLNFRDEDVLAAIDAMRWALERLREEGFPLARAAPNGQGNELI